ncbi:MAG: NYN domain-containing protein [Candidatus Aerophobus sp.]|nr:MAG: NYN domain-containing protein [Candidatus Aerophobus sp.]
MTKRACVFVDGENFRHSICHLFGRFDPSEYLPEGRWEEFFDWLVQKAGGSDTRRLRTYWYVIEYIDFFPSFFSDPEQNPDELRQFYTKSNQEYKSELENLSGTDLISRLTKITRTLEERKVAIEKRFGGWQVIHNAIALGERSIEFRREAGLRYDLFKKRFGQEKAIDVKLAVDLLELRSIYDVAVIVPGDQDDVPAVKVVKDSGKQVVNVSFRRLDARTLPGGAKRLNRVTDWSCVVSHDEFPNYLDL